VEISKACRNYHASEQLTGQWRNWKRRLKRFLREMKMDR
jgi:hypothetical protein